MLNQLANVQVWVNDQDEALAFYTEKLGFEIREDVTVPGARELPLALSRRSGAGRRDRADAPYRRAGLRRRDAAADPRPAREGRLRRLFFTTEDCRGSYEKLARARRRVHAGAEPSSRTALTPASAILGNQFRMVAASLAVTTL